MTVKIKLIITLGFLFLSCSIFAQEGSGTIIFRPYPVNNEIYVKILDSVYTYPKVKLPSGKYDITLWSPDKKPMNTSISIYTDSIVFFKEYMPPTSAFSNYRKELKEHKKKNVIPKLISVGVSAVLIANSARIFKEVNLQWPRVENFYALYRSASFHNIDKAEDEYENQKEVYSDLKKKFKTSTIIGGASVIANAVIFYSLRKNKKPIKPIDKSPFLISFIPFSDLSSSNIVFSFQKIF